MGVKLESFLRVIGSALSPQAAQANTAQYAAEKADERLQQREGRAQLQANKANDFKMGIKVVSTRMAAAQAAMKAGDKGAYSEIMTGVGTYIDENFEGKNNALFKNLAGDTWIDMNDEKKTPIHADIKLQNEIKRLRGLESTPETKERITQLTNILNKKGTVTGTTGHDPSALNKKTKNKVQDTLIKTRDSLARLGEIKRTYKENFLTYKTRVGELFTAVKEQAGFKLNKEDRVKLGEFAKFRRKTFSFLNEYIHDMSGAAVSVQEAVRMKKALPTMDDSPTEYIAKMEDLMGELEAKQTRYEYWINNGIVDENTNDKSLRSLESEFPQKAFSGINKAREAISNSKDPQARDKALARLTPWFEENGYDIRLLDDL